MDKYKIIDRLGEGSFGRVYKAKQLSNSKFVAVKVISKIGRSNKELIGLRRECEIQRHLEHPNIIQMLDSFETDKEIVVITEFAHKELHCILGEKKRLNEEKVQRIVWDLVSALYYLHSNRVLHRDLKPQNILLDINDCAKLCDFGFARNMSTGTHVLTSIKGTPLYMAPELIEELPYDHNVDLWSLGCIIYELLVGTTPFYTNSILHLIRLIKHEQIQWPTFLSVDCTSFLRGLLDKNPAQRMSWSTILGHPFVAGHVLMLTGVDDSQIIAISQPLTRSLSENTLVQKEKQIGEIIEQKSKDNPTKKLQSATYQKNITTITEQTAIINLEQPKTVEETTKTSTNEVKITGNIHTSFVTCDDSQPIENDEWIVFLNTTISEVLNSDFTSFGQVNLTNVLVTPLKNCNASCMVVDLVAKLFSLPFNISNSSLKKIVKVYKDVKLIPNLVYSMTMLAKQSNSSATIAENEEVVNLTRYKRNDEFTKEELNAIESIVLLICYLVHYDEQFLLQFCDSVLVLKIYDLVNQLITLGNRKIAIVFDLLAILNQVLRKLPENVELVDKVILHNDKQPEELINFVSLLRNSNNLVRERACVMIKLLAKYSPKTVENFWNDIIKQTMEALLYDSAVIVRNTAEIVIDDLKSYDFYKTDNDLNAIE